MKKPVNIFIAAAVLLCLASPLFAGEINLSVAASLKEVFNELADSYAKTHPGVSFRKNYGASGALAKQIENGGPADIFVSANSEWLDYLNSRKLTDGASSAVLAYNVLVFAGRPDLKITAIQEVVKLDKIAIGSPKSVPAGEYAMAALKKAGIDRQLEKKLVMAKDVRECLLYAERGEVDGAFVYKTDAQQVAKAAKILFTVPQGYYPRVTYPMALTVAGAKNRDATAFYAVLKSAEAQAVLKKHGFVVK
ncbi:MAG: molybdate ABC transporter substrate-binding protein [Geobacter sp.]|nr:molybdate ABC transporter substrate-binding protein [Geobacter sp.]